MSFQWLLMRISEEKDRRKRQIDILERLPRALDEVNGGLAACIESYHEAFGAQAAELVTMPEKTRIIVREERGGNWEQFAEVEVVTDPAIPGFQVERGSPDPLVIEVGMLPGEKLFYRDRAKDQYVTMEELTRRILDRAFFPRLSE